MTRIAQPIRNGTREARKPGREACEEWFSWRPGVPVKSTTSLPTIMVSVCGVAGRPPSVATCAGVAVIPGREMSLSRRCGIAQTPA